MMCRKRRKQYSFTHFIQEPPVSWGGVFSDHLKIMNEVTKSLRKCIGLGEDRLEKQTPGDKHPLSTT